MTHGSLFSGIGGFDLGFQRAEIETVWQVEIDDYCRKVLAKHFPEVKRFSDIKEVGAHNLEKVDIISGGFPCQDISVAGKRIGLSGERSGLWFEMFRVISELRPRFAVVENVPMLIRLGLDRVLANFASIGYDVEWTIISAKQVGAWHKRERIWIIAYPKNLDVNRCIEEKTNRSLGKCNESGRLLWGETRPIPCRMVDGLSCGVDRLRALGNAIVPQIAEYIGHRIIETEDDD